MFLIKKDWFELNIDFGKSEWYCTFVQNDAYDPQGVHSKWHQLPIGESPPVNVAFMVPPGAVSNTLMVSEK